MRCIAVVMATIGLEMPRLASSRLTPMPRMVATAADTIRTSDERAAWALAASRAAAILSEE